MKKPKGRIYKQFVSQDPAKVAVVRDTIRMDMGGAVSITTGARVVRFNAAEIHVYCLVARFKPEAT
jgi:hypothetical protein